MEKAVGGKVRVVRTNPATGVETSETAEVLSTAGGTVMRIGNRIEVLRDDNLPARVIFDKVPDNLRARPTLSVLVNAAKAANAGRAAHLPHRGLSWDADYVAVFDEPRGTLSHAGLDHAHEQVGHHVSRMRARSWSRATSMSRDSENRLAAQQQRPPAPQRTCRAPKAGSRSSSATTTSIRSRTRTTIANNQTKQVELPRCPARERQQGLRDHVLAILVERRAGVRPGARAILELEGGRPAASSCRPAWCASTRATRAASRSSSARTASGIPAPARTSRCVSAMPST